MDELVRVSAGFKGEARTVATGQVREDRVKIASLLDTLHTEKRHDIVSNKGKRHDDKPSECVLARCIRSG